MNSTRSSVDIPPLAFAVAVAAKAHGGRALIVGGAVRDSIMGNTPKDFDLEIFGINESEVEPVLSKADNSGGIHIQRVGRSFPVWKIWGRGSDQSDAIDIALPRREVKTGIGHTDFGVELCPTMTFEDAASRRDFTINAIGYDPLTAEFIDPHGGMKDINSRTLRHVSDHFGEDPLRVLRGMQFAARFGMTAAPETIKECRNLSPLNLSRERIFGEFEKLILKGEKPSMGMGFLRETGWVRHFPELNAMIGVQQSSKHHPEGDCWTHTCHCMDAVPASRTGNVDDDRMLGFAVLCHDLGKPSTTEFSDGDWRAHGHEEAGESPTRTFLGAMTADAGLIDGVVGLVVAHMRPHFAYREAQNGKNVDRAVRRMAMVTRLDLLAEVLRCDSAGRPPLPATGDKADWLLVQSARLGVTDKAPSRLVMGKDLIAAGFTPGKHFGEVLDLVYQMQIDGDVQSPEEALAVAVESLTARSQTIIDSMDVIPNHHRARDGIADARH